MYVLIYTIFLVEMLFNGSDGYSIYPLSLYAFVMILGFVAFVYIGILEEEPVLHILRDVTIVPLQLFSGMLVVFTHAMVFKYLCDDITLLLLHGAMVIIGTINLALNSVKFRINKM